MTPVKVDVFEKLLQQSNYSSKKTKFLTQGFREGFRLNYEGPRKGRVFSRNLRLRVGTKTHLWNKLMKEVKLRRVAGPWKLEDFPLKDFFQSPIGLCYHLKSFNEDQLYLTEYSNLLIYQIARSGGETRVYQRFQNDIPSFSPQELINK